MNTNIEAAKEHFGKLLEKQLARVEEMKKNKDFLDYSKLDEIVIGIVGGDGIGPYITAEAEKILKFLLEGEKVVFKEIEGCTIENRAGPTLKAQTLQ